MSSWKRSAAICLLALMAGACSDSARKTGRAGGSSGDSSAPTIVLVSIDTLRADRVGFMGRENAGTGVMDRLAAEGVVFERAQTTAPLTLPAHASLLSGRSLGAHGVVNNGTFALPEALPTLAGHLAAAGYATGAFVSSPVLSRRYGLDRGFDRYDDRVPRLKAEKGLVIHYPERAGVKTVDSALAWLMDQKDKPALLWVHLWEPHAPYTPPQPFAGKFGDRYQGEVAAADAALGRLVKGVESAGRGSRALYVVTSDHGEGLGAHGEPTHGVFLYQETMAVPLLISGPGWGIVSGRCTEPVSLIDIAPTLLGLAQVERLAGADGISLEGILRGQAAPPDRPGVFAESHLPAIEFGWSGLRALVGEDRKLIDSPRPELYDLVSDPIESEDLAASESQAVSAMQRELARLVADARAFAPKEGAERSASEEELEVLRSLGYSASGQATSQSRLVDPEKTDPKDRVEFLEAHDRAIGLTRTGHATEAVAALKRLQKIEPANPSLFMQLGQAQIVAKDIDGALETFEKAVAVAPEFAMAWYRLGMLRGNRGDLPGEETAYRRSIELDSFSVDVHKALAGVVAEQGRTHEAIQVLEKARDLDPGDPGIRKELELLWEKTRK